MCMKITSAVLVAKRDIPVYKVFKGVGKELNTAFFDTPISEVLGARTRLSNERGYCSYPNKKTAVILKKHLREFNASIWGSAKIIKCYIPKGTLYCKGIDEQCSSATNGKSSLQSEYLRSTEQY